MGIKFNPPYLGGAYYPEDWDEDVMDYDIAMMQKANINVVRIVEFAWSKMELEEGKFTFDWLHRVVDKLGEAGIATVMCTPTATPPRWLSVNHPDVMMEKEDGRINNHGGRRACCSPKGKRPRGIYHRGFDWQGRTLQAPVCGKGCSHRQNTGRRDHDCSIRGSRVGKTLRRFFYPCVLIKNDIRNWVHREIRV